MTQALSSPARDVRQCLDGLIEAMRRLTDDFGVTVKYSPHVPRCQVGRLDSDTRTVFIRETAPIDDQVWLLGDVWYLLAVGPHATSGARKQPTLWLVPEQRTGS